MISKKIASVITSVMVFCCIVGVSLTNVKADDSAPKSVDGSYLTSADSSTGYTPKNNERGKHLMDGQCSISKTGTKRIYAYGSTTANHTVDAVAVIVYVDQYNEKDDEWYQIDAFSKKVENNGDSPLFLCNRTRRQVKMEQFRSVQYGIAVAQV